MERVTGKLVRSMAKIGIVGLGGGTALVPLMEKEAVEDGKLVNQEQFDKDFAVAGITPGALPVEIAAGIGNQLAGRLGMVISALSITTPGVILVLAVLTIFAGRSESAMRPFYALSIGITAMILCYISYFLLTVLKKAKETSRQKLIRTLIVIAGVFVLSGEKNVYKLLGIERDPIFGLSMIQVMFLAIGVLIIRTWYQAVIQKKGGHGALPADPKGTAVSLLQDEMTWLTFMLIGSIPAIIVLKSQALFLPYALLSSFLSFGGGDAFLSIADGMFVAGGYITEDMFYGQLVPTVNMLPGSILCKVLSGTGYTLGYAAGGGVLPAVLVGISGMCIGIGGSGMTFCLMYHLYDLLIGSELFIKLNRWIRAIVGGLLISVMLNLIYQVTKSSAVLEVPSFAGLGFAALSFVILWYLFYIRKWSSGWLMLCALVPGIILIVVLL